MLSNFFENPTIFFVNRIDEPDGEQIYYCSNCNCRAHEIVTSGEDEEFSDEGELDGENHSASLFLNNPINLQHIQTVRVDPTMEAPVSNSSSAGEGGENSNSDSLPLPAPLQSPRTPVPSTTSVNLTLARVEELGWQENRSTLTARAGYLLNNSRMSDVKFLVGESKVEIYAHKTLLALGSPVFEAQFYGSVGSGAVDVIELPDMEPETFVMFLKVNKFLVEV